MSQLSLHWRQRNTYLSEDAGNATTGRIIRRQAGNFVTLEGECDVFHRERDFFAGGWNRRHSRHGQNERVCVSTGDLDCCYHFITLLYFFVRVERPVLEGILKCALNCEKLLFA